MKMFFYRLHQYYKLMSDDEKAIFLVWSMFLILAAIYGLIYLVRC